MLPVRLNRGAAQASLSAEVEDENVLLYVEQWPDAERLNEEIRSVRFGRILALMETAAEAPRLEFRFFAEIQGLDYVAEVRGEPRLADVK